MSYFLSKNKKINPILLKNINNLKFDLSPHLAGLSPFSYFLFHAHMSSPARLEAKTILRNDLDTVSQSVHLQITTLFSFFFFSSRSCYILHSPLALHFLPFPED